MPRRMIVCMNCGERKEHAAHGLCAACRQRARREQEQELTDRHTGALDRDDVRLIRGYTRVMLGCAQIKVSGADLFKMREVLRPYIESVEPFLPHRAARSAPSEPHGEPQSEPTTDHLVNAEADGDNISATDSQLSPTDSPVDEG